MEPGKNPVDIISFELQDAMNALLTDVCFLCLRASKTTLMDVLAGRKTGGYIEGDIRISGYPKVQETFARISGYCEQTDIHSPQVTVRESLIYSAWLRLSSSIDAESKMVRTPTPNFTANSMTSVCNLNTVSSIFVVEILK